MLALRNELESAVAEATATQAELAARTSALTEAEKLRLVELAAAEELRRKLQESAAEVTAMTMALEEKRAKAEDTLTMLAAAEAAKSALEVANAALQGTSAASLTEAEKQRLALMQANRLLDEQEALSAESQREVALLNQQTGELRKQLNALQGLLDESEARDEEAQVQIEALGTNLNTALAQVASEQRKVAEEQRKLAGEQTLRADLEARERVRLEEEAKDLRRYRSEFFARVGEVLGGREGVQVVGDRFVFSSEVLFEPASATLGGEGRAQIAEVAAVIREVSGAIPAEIDWILRVDGHTDNKPLTGGGEFADNWELSQARALSVVKYLVDFEGIPANRLAATGFGEFQPVDAGSSPDALARNRRIELKFTER
jgi:chemotaxis protein MotB